MEKPEDDVVDPTITAETKMAMILVQHNTFLTINTGFKESPTAQYFCCSCIKTADIVNCIGDFLLPELLEDMKSHSLQLNAGWKQR